MDDITEPSDHWGQTESPQTGDFEEVWSKLVRVQYISVSASVSDTWYP